MKISGAFFLGISVVFGLHRKSTILHSANPRLMSSVSLVRFQVFVNAVILKRTAPKFVRCIAKDNQSGWFCHDKTCVFMLFLGEIKVNVCRLTFDNFMVKFGWFIPFKNDNYTIPFSHFNNSNILYFLPTLSNDQ